MQDFFLKSRGVAYRTNTLNPERETLLFIHGLSGSASAWELYERHFEETHNVITFDLRGHGKSLRPRTYAEYALEAFADDIEALLEELGVEQCVAVSHSFGTQVSLVYSLRSARVSRHVFLAPVYGLHRLRYTRLWHPLWLLASRLPPKWGRGARVDYTPFSPSADWDLRRIYADVGNTGMWSYFSALRHSYDAKTDALWEQVRVPTLIIHGTDDSFIPIAHARELVEKIANASLIELPGANHMLVLNEPQEIVKGIEEFV